MTTYKISLGYNPQRVDYDDMWEILKQEVSILCDNPSAIVTEARRLGSPEFCEEGCCRLGTFADNYREDRRKGKPYLLGSYGHPVRIDEDDRLIIQGASTGDAIKYHVRRAFVRLLIEALHRQEIEVNLVVV